MTHGAVIVWDVAGGRGARAVLRSHRRGRRGMDVSADGRTLYTASHDTRVIAWDLAGDRRLDRPFDPGPPFALDDGRPAASRSARTGAGSPSPRTTAPWTCSTRGRCAPRGQLPRARRLRRRGRVQPRRAAARRHRRARARHALGRAHAARRPASCAGCRPHTRRRSRSRPTAACWPAADGRGDGARSGCGSGTCAPAAPTRVRFRDLALVAGLLARRPAAGGRREHRPHPGPRRPHRPPGRRACAPPTRALGRVLARRHAARHGALQRHDPALVHRGLEARRAGARRPLRARHRARVRARRPHAAERRRRRHAPAVGRGDAASRSARRRRSSRTATSPPSSRRTASACSRSRTVRSACAGTCPPEAWKQHACAVAGRELSAREWSDALPGRPYQAVCHGG